MSRDSLRDLPKCRCFPYIHLTNQKYLLKYCIEKNGCMQNCAQSQVLWTNENQQKNRVFAFGSELFLSVYQSKGFLICLTFKRFTPRWAICFNWWKGIWPMTVIRRLFYLYNEPPKKVSWEWEYTKWTF